MRSLNLIAAHLGIADKKDFSLCLVGWPKVLKFENMLFFPFPPSLPLNALHHRVMQHWPELADFDILRRRPDSVA